MESERNTGRIGTIAVIDAAGTLRHVRGAFGRSIMEILKGHDLLPGICGGCCSCASCHVLVAPEWSAICAPPDSDERDLLSGLQTGQATSRLSCQIPFVQALEGITVTIAPED